MDNGNDPYLWLENISSNEVLDWIDEKTKITKQYLNSIPYRDDIRKTVEKFCNQPKHEIGITGVWVHENNIYYMKNDGLENVGKLCSMDIDTGLETLLVDPSKIPGLENVHICLVSILADGKYVGFTTSKTGSDWCELRVLDTHNGLVLPDTIEWTKISDLGFFEDGFFYSRFDKPPAGEETTSIPKGHRLCYHRFGTETSQDEIVLDKNSFIESMSFEHDTTIWGTLFEGRYLVARCDFPARIQWICKDLSIKENKFRILFETQQNERISLLGAIEGKAYFLMARNGSNAYIASFDLEFGQQAELKSVIPGDGLVIKGATCDCGKIFVSCLDDVKTTIKQFDKTGQLEKEIELPFICTARTSSGPANNRFSVVQIESFLTPRTLYKLDIKTGCLSPIFNDKIDIKPNDYEIRQIFFNSFDDTRVPMFVFGKKGAIKDKTRPIILSGYGASNIANTPYYSYLALSLLESGGVYAVANIRGGGEYGLNWHKAGSKQNRNNSFRDFICAAEFLISEGFTSKEQLAIYGGSNGGTMVASCMNIRPDLFKVVVANSGLHDMLRFHKIGHGFGWINEYGNPDVELDRAFLKGYSPIHNIRPEFAYPAVILLVCENDDRVSPVHSFKLIDAFDRNNVKGGPFLLRIQKDGGHKFRRISGQVDEFADILSFVLWHTKKN